MAEVNSGAATSSTQQTTDDAVGRAAVLEFVRTPFAVRRNVVKVWHSLPEHIWSALSTRQDHLFATWRERRAVAGVVLMATVLLAGFSGAGMTAAIDSQDVCVPLLGRTTTRLVESHATSTWCYVSGKSLSLVAWTVVPSLAGWVCMRWFWIPVVGGRGDSGRAAVNFARHLGSVYLYVYLMILVGALIMPLLILASPEGTAFIRWCLWCFLFGESFFVPAVMWGRLILHGRSGQVFGRWRVAGLGLYLLLFVVAPILGMVTELK